MKFGTRYLRQKLLAALHFDVQLSVTYFRLIPN